MDNKYDMSDFSILALTEFDMHIEPNDDILKIIRKRQPLIMENQEIISNLRNIQLHLNNILYITQNY